MSHEIDGERAIYAKTPAWHRLGVVKQAGWMTADECLAALNPNGDVVTKVPAFARVIVDGKVIEVTAEDKVALVEPHPDIPGQYRLLSFMDKDYGVIQLEDQFRFLDQVVGQIGGAHYASAARLRKGKQTIVTIDTGQISLDPKGADDRIDRFIFGSNSYDGSWAFRAKMVGNRVDCANMAAVALRHQTTADWSTRHTKEVMSRAHAAAATLGLWNAYFEDFAEEAELMIQTPVNDNTFTRIIEGLFEAQREVVSGEKTLTDKDKDNMNEVRAIYELSPTVEKIRGTAWGALQSVTEWSDWYTQSRGGKNSNVQEARLRRQMGETDRGFKQTAWDMFRDLADDKVSPVSVSVG